MDKFSFSDRPAKKLLFSFSLILMCGLISLIGILTAFANYYIQKNAHENLTFVISRLSNDLDNCLQDLSKSCESLATNTRIQRFLYEEQRYTDTQTVIDTYNTVASQSSYINGAVLFDREGYFYRYGSVSFSNADCLSLYENIPEQSGYRLVSFKDAPYLCYMQGVYNFEDRSMPHIGYAVVFTRLNLITELLNQYNIYNNLSLLLTRNGEIIASGGAEGSLPEKGSSVYMESCDLRTKPYQLTVYIPKGDVFPYNTALILLIIGACILIALMMTAYIQHINSSLTTPIDTVIQELCGISGNAHSRLSPSDVPWLNRMITSINELLARVEEYSHRAFDTQQRLYEAELDKQKMDLYLLRKQINAHFAYNSLNSIHAIAAEHDERDIQLIAAGLAELMRYSYSPEEYINIFEEMQLIDQYIAIMNIRFRDKFQVEYNFDDRLCEYMILRQIIQPLVENALLHGLENKTEDCCLWIDGSIDETDPDTPFLTISVRDNGIGIPEDKLRDYQKRIAEQKENYSPSGIAMINIHRRIQLYHGAKYGLTITSREGEGTAVSFTFPLVRDSSL